MKLLQKEGKHPNKTHGFTLVEMIVAVGIFLIILSIGGSAIVSVYDANRQAHDQQPIMDNFSVVVEDMTRTIRTGDLYDCGNAEGPYETPGQAVNAGNCSNGASALSLNSAQQGAVTYELENGQILKSWQSAVDGTTQYVNFPLTQDAIQVDTLQFYVSGSDLNNSDNEQAYVTLHIEGHIETQNETTDINLQTTITER